MKDEKERGRGAHPLNYGSRRMAMDPALLAEEAEERTCKGCAHEYWIEVANSARKACSRNRRHGQRCAEYDDAQ